MRVLPLLLFIAGCGPRIVFFGDSITLAAGAKDGFIPLVIAGLSDRGTKFVPVNAGAGGNTSDDLLARVDRDVFAHNPVWMTLNCGINDVFQQVPPERFADNVSAMVRKAEVQGVSVVLLTSTLIGEQELDGAFNELLVPYDEALRRIARDHHLPLADVSVAFRTAVSMGQGPITTDGIHPNARGSAIIAEVLLAALPDALMETVADAPRRCSSTRSRLWRGRRLRVELHP